MNTAQRSRRQGRRLLQVGILLFLGALLVGLFVPKFAVPRLGLATHLLGVTQGLFLLAAGLLWPQLKLSRTLSAAGFGLAIYGCLAAWLANLFAAISGAGNTLLPMAAGQAHGSAAQELLIMAGLRTSAVALLAAALLILWGLRGHGANPPEA